VGKKRKKKEILSCGTVELTLSCVFCSDGTIMPSIRWCQLCWKPQIWPRSWPAPPGRNSAHSRPGRKEGVLTVRQASPLAVLCLSYDVT
jgi:hypothetical protein